MSDLPDPNQLNRRELLHAAGTGAALALAGAGLASSGAMANPARDNGPLGLRLQGVQHFGVTVQNMDRAFAFYTEVLGGTEVMRDGDFHGERIHNTLLTDQEIEARERQVNPRDDGRARTCAAARSAWTCASSSSTTS